MSSQAGRGPEVRALLVGYGLAGRAFHAPLLAAADDLRLAGIVVNDEGRRAQARAEHPRAELLRDAQAAFDPERFDLAVIAAPNRFHVTLAAAALEAGLAVVVDKPLAPTAAQARELVDLARRRGRLLVPFHNRRWDGDALTLERLLAAGALGEVARFESRFERWRPQVSPGWRERAEPADAGGVLLDLGTHLVDQALHLFGPAVEVHGELAARRAGARVDDDAFVALTHRSGVRSHLWASLVAPHQGPRLRVLGTRAAYVKHGLDVQEAALRAGAPAGGPGWGAEPEAQWGRLVTGDGAATPVPTEPGAYPAFYAGVVAALREGAAPPVDPAAAVAVLEVLDAVRARAG